MNSRCRNQAIRVCSPYIFHLPGRWPNGLRLQVKLTEFRSCALHRNCHVTGSYAGGGSEASSTVTTNTVFGLREGTLWGLLSAISFAVHLVRSEIRQHEAKDIGQLAAAQLIVCGVLSLGLLAWTGNHDPLLSPQLSPGVIASVRFYLSECHTLCSVRASSACAYRRRR